MKMKTMLYLYLLIACSVKNGKILIHLPACISDDCKTFFTGFSQLRSATFANLPTGDVVANFEGTMNDPTLTCNVTNDEGLQISTFWSVANFEGVLLTRALRNADPDGNIFFISGDLRPSNVSFGNRVTVLNWTSSVDEAILHCGTGSIPQQANVTLRLYSKFLSLQFNYSAALT